VCSLIKFHDFDIFGTQEGKHNQLIDMKAAMPDYDFIGVGRQDSTMNGEFSAIFYKTNKFKLLDKGNFWLSDTPEKPSVGWDAKYTRLCSWGAFEEKETGFRFYFFNLHNDHKGVEARKNSSHLVLRKITEIAGNSPTILTGDFNETQTSECYRIIETSNLLADTYDLAKIRYSNGNTFNGFIFKLLDNPQIDTTFLIDNTRIDHIFLTSQFTVGRWGLLTDTYRVNKNSVGSYETRLPSDHYPVVAKIRY
jgi:endonuclease/exonuclease/phosphatase family metal-dependent hydrolase